MGLFAWIVMGLIAGALGKLLLPGKDPGGLIVTILIGIAGAIIGGYIGTAMGFGGVTGLNLGSIVTAILGSVLLLLLYRMIKR